MSVTQPDSEEAKIFQSIAQKVIDEVERQEIETEKKTPKIVVE